eukprot:2618269-Lingulodinium_polyedra.AAC.1
MLGSAKTRSRATAIVATDARVDLKVRNGADPKQASLADVVRVAKWICAAPKEPTGGVLDYIATHLGIAKRAERANTVP